MRLRQRLPLRVRRRWGEFRGAGQDLARAHEALAATTAWVKNDLGLVMKAALVPVACVRAQAPTCVWLVSHPRPTSLRNVLWRRIRVGRWRHAAGRVRGCFPPPGVRPDLTGLSCRSRDAAARGLVFRC